MMKNNKITPVILAASMLLVPVPTYAAEYVPGPGQEYTEEVYAQLQDNVIEYNEIPLLIEEYNPTLENMRDMYHDQKNSYKDVEHLKDQIYDGAESMQEGADMLSDMASLYEGLMQMTVTPMPPMPPMPPGGVTPPGGGMTPGPMIPPIPGLDMSKLGTSYADVTYSAALLRQQSEQMYLMADTVTEMTPEMMRIKMSDTTRAGLTQGAQSAMIGYHQLLLQKENLNDTISLLEDVVRSTEGRMSIGLATQSDVLKARQNLENARSGLLAIDSGIISTRQSLGLLLGWKHDSVPEVREIPAVDLSVIATKNPDTDIPKAIEANYTMRVQLLDLENKTYGSVEKTTLERTIKDQKEQIAASIRNLYQDILVKQGDYQMAQTALALETTKMQSAELKYGVGAIGRMEYRQQQNAFHTKETALKTAELALFQAISTYDWAVAGNLTIS